MNKNSNNWQAISKVLPVSTMIAAGTLLAALSGCSSGGSGMGSVSASLTDAPACGYDHVYVTVSSVGVNSDVNGNGNWYDITLPTPRKIDLLNLTNGALESLGQTALPAGTYQQLRLVLVANSNSNNASFNNSVVPSGQTTEVALKTPSAQQSGIKLNTRQPFTVQPNTLVDLTLDFNACRSIVTTGRSNSNNGQGTTGYLLKPVVSAVPAVVSGSIDGYVDLADATTTTTVNNVLTSTPGATVYAEQNGVIVRGTIADANGHFILSPLEQSSGAGPYDVVIVNGGKTSVIVGGIPVTAQADTAISTQATPFTLVASSTGTVQGNASTATYPEATLAASQTINAGTYTIATTNADSATGDYSFTLPTAAPQFAVYATPLPIVTTAQTSVAGKYTITASTTTATTAPSSQSVTAPASGVNF